MSGDKAQEYFSDGLTEELLNSLVRINELQEAFAGYSEAIHLDPEFAMAYADRSLVLDGISRNYATSAKRRDSDGMPMRTPCLRS